MRVSSIYDEQLVAIEEAEEKVRLATLNLQEAETELDETLNLVEAELELLEAKEFVNNKKLTEHKILRPGEWGLEQKEKEDSNWELVNRQGEPGRFPGKYETREGAEQSNAYWVLFDKKKAGKIADFRVVNGDVTGI